MMSPEVLIAFALMLMAIGSLVTSLWHDRAGGRCQTRITQLEAEADLAAPIVNAAAPGRDAA
jgi:hypothetical protein